jgi:hypothetical protein
VIRAALKKAAIALANSIDAKHLQTLIKCHETAKNLCPPFSEQEVLRASLEFYFNAMGMDESRIPNNISVVFQDSQYQLNEQASPPNSFSELCIRTILFERGAEIRGTPLEYVEEEVARVYRLVARLFDEPLPDF